MSDDRPTEPTDGPREFLPPPPPNPDPLAAAARSYDPQPLDGQQSPTADNWMGIVALITAILGFIVVPIVFAILGLNSVKKGKANNRGLSIAAIVISVVYVLIAAVVAIALIAFAVNTTTSSTAAVGKCYTTSLTSAELQDVSREYGECTAATNAEIYYIANYTGAVDYDEDGFTDELYAFCTTDEAIANVDPDVAANYYIEYYVASTEDWEGGDHAVVCALFSDTGPIDEGAVLND